MSNIGNLIALMGAGVGGYTKGRRQATDDAQEKTDRDEERAYKRTIRERESAEYDKKTGLERDLGNAWMTRSVAPNMVKPEDADNRDVGQPGTQLEQDGFRVEGLGGRHFADQGAAQAAADTGNTPSAALAREREVYGMRGMQDKVRLLDDQTQARELNTLQLDDTKRKLAQEAGLRDMGSMLVKGGWAAVPEAYKQYRDGRKVEVVEDGKGGASVRSIDEANGKLLGEQRYASLPELFNEFAGSFDPKLWVAGLDKAAGDKRAERRLDIDQQNANALGEYRAKMADAAVVRAGSSGKRADHFDERQWDAANKIEPSFVSFTDDMGGKAVESPELRLVYRAEMNKHRQGGAKAPNDAAEAARTTTLMLKSAAEQRVAAAKESDPSSTLSAGQAVQQLLKEFEAANKTAPKPPSAGPAAAPPKVNTRPTMSDVQASARATQAPPPAGALPAANQPAETAQAMSRVQQQVLLQMSLPEHGKNPALMAAARTELQRRAEMLHGSNPDVQRAAPAMR